MAGTSADNFFPQILSVLYIIITVADYSQIIAIRDTFSVKTILNDAVSPEIL